MTNQLSSKYLLATSVFVLALSTFGLAQNTKLPVESYDFFQSPAAHNLGQRADINGAQIYYEIKGQGQPLIFIHGYPLNGRFFIRQQEELAQEFRVITIDLRGFGKSNAPNLEASINLYARDVLGLLNILGISQAFIAGHSMGGMTALQLFRLAPDRFRGMILIDTTAAPASIIEQYFWNGLAEQVRQQGISSISPYFVTEMLTGDGRFTRPLLVRFIQQLIAETSFHGAIGGAMALALRPDNTNLLQTIKIPTLIVVGVEDKINPIELSQQIDKQIPNSELAIIQGASHAANLEEGTRVNRTILRWIKKQTIH